MSYQQGLDAAYLDDDQLDPEQRKRKITQSPYYKQLQTKLAQKNQENQNLSKTQASKEQQSNHFNKPKKEHLYAPRFKWSQSDKGWQMKPKEAKAVVNTLQTFEKSTDVLVTFLGYKIDLSTQKNALIDKYMKVYIETKSHNLLLAKFAEIKLGMLQMILSFLGTSLDELKAYQKKSVSTKVDEIKLLFEQNEYNLEMIQLFSNEKKSKTRKKILLEIREQHQKNLAQLGQPDYINPERIILAQQKAVRSVLEDMNQESQALELLLVYPL